MDQTDTDDFIKYFREKEMKFETYNTEVRDNHLQNAVEKVPQGLKLSPYASKYDGKTVSDDSMRICLRSPESSRLSVGSGRLSTSSIHRNSDGKGLLHSSHKIFSSPLTRKHEEKPINWMDEAPRIKISPSDHSYSRENSIFDRNHDRLNSSSHDKSENSIGSPIRRNNLDESLLSFQSPSSKIQSPNFQSPSKAHDFQIPHILTPSPKRSTRLNQTPYDPKKYGEEHSFQSIQNNLQDLRKSIHKLSPENTKQTNQLVTSNSFDYMMEEVENSLVDSTKQRRKGTCFIPSFYSPYEIHGRTTVSSKVMSTHLFLTGRMQKISLSYPSRYEFFSHGMDFWKRRSESDREMGRKYMIGQNRVPDYQWKDLILAAPKSNHEFVVYCMMSLEEADNLESKTGILSCSWHPDGLNVSMNEKVAVISIIVGKHIPYLWLTPDLLLSNETNRKRELLFWIESGQIQASNREHLCKLQMVHPINRHQEISVNCPVVFTTLRL